MSVLDEPALRITTTTGVELSGAGCTTAIGLSAPATVAAFRAGISGVREHPYMVDRSGNALSAAFFPAIAAFPSLEERIARHAMLAAEEALLAAGLQASDELSFALALPEPRPGFDRDRCGMVAELLSAELRRCFRIAAPVLFPTGHTAALAAIAWSARAVAHDPRAICLVGAIDSYLDAETLDWLEDQELLKTAEHPFGIIPGEAAAFAVIVARGARSDAARFAQPQVVSMAREKHLRSGDGICIGEGLTRAARGALSATADRPSYAICDLNGDRYRADEFALTAVRVADLFENGLEFETPADCLGDIGAASGLVSIILARRRTRVSMRPTTVLISTSSLGDTRATALVRTA